MDRYTYVSAAPLKRPPGRGGKAIQSHLLHLCDELVHTTAVTPKTIVECATSLRQKICPMVSKWFQSGFKVVSWWFHGGFKVVSRGPPQRGLGREGAAGGRGGAGPPQRGRGRGGGPPQRGLGGGHFKLIPTSGHDCLRRHETTHETTMKPP